MSEVRATVPVYVPAFTGATSFVVVYVIAYTGVSPPTVLPNVTFQLHSLPSNVNSRFEASAQFAVITRFAIV